MTTLSPALLLTKARTSLILSQPFFGSLALKLKLIEDESCETAMTNGKWLRYNPNWISGLSLDEVKGVFCHEVLHCALNHISRRGPRKARKFNAACDYALNPIVIESGMVLPDGLLLNPAYKGMSAEQIYNLLPDSKDDDGDGDPGGCGGVEDGKNDDGQPLTPAQAQQQETEWKIATEQAAQVARAQGSLPGGLDKLVSQLVNPVIDWKSQLRRFVDQIAKSDYSWMRPNRRFVSNGIYLPSAHSEELGPIVIGVDTSGSIDQKMLDQFAGEIQGILADYKTTATVIYCDAAVQGVEEFTSEDTLELHPKGGGGTAFAPCLQHVEDNDIQPSCMIYLTDGWGSHGDHEPPFPLLWALTEGANDDVPFGEIVRLR